MATAETITPEIKNHDLPYGDGTNWMSFHVGTCVGWFGENDQSIDVFGIGNSCPGNGHFDAALEFMLNMCKDRNKDMVIEHFVNEGFMKHMIGKRGFSMLGNTSVIMRIRS